MLKTRSTLTALILFCTFAANAQSTAPSAGNAKGQPDPAKFAEHKQKILTHVQMRLQSLQTLQSCVQSANDHAAIKACEQTAHQSMPHHDMK